VSHQCPTRLFLKILYSGNISQLCRNKTQWNILETVQQHRIGWGKVVVGG
jgi:hypothetical protein